VIWFNVVAFKKIETYIYKLKTDLWYIFKCNLYISIDLN